MPTGKKISFQEIKYFVENELKDKYGLKILDNECQYSTTKLRLIDNLGYKYFLSYRDIIKNYKRNYGFNIVSPSNPFSCDNIKNYIKLNNLNIVLLSDEYKNAKTKMKFKCKKGHIFYACWNAIQQGKNCPQCFGKFTKTTEQFKKEVFELVGNEYTVMSEYINARTYIKMKHNQCNKIYNVIPDAFLRGNRCPYCFGVHKKTTEQFKKEIFELVGNEYEVLSEYKNYQEKIKIRHNKCGFIWDLTAGSFLQGTRCPKCKGSIKNKDTEYFKKEVYAIVGEEYEVIGEYCGAKNNIRMLHKQCGKYFNVRPSNFLNGTRCPHCKRSKGEERIEKKLRNTDVFYINQFKFDECKGKRNKLPFDFAVYNKQHKLILLIEYDGEQHFKNIKYWGKKFNHDTVKKNDKIKNQYCIDNNIPLIRIPCWEYDNIEYILKNVLMHYDLIEKDDTYDESVVKKYLVDKDWDHDKYIEMGKNYK